jgi:Zinc finger, C2H2 type
MHHDRYTQIATLEKSVCIIFILNMNKINHFKRSAFACPVQDCGRSFSVLSNMRRHARSHGSYAISSSLAAPSDHYPLSLSSASSNLSLPSSSPIQLHRRYGDCTSGSSSTSRKKTLNFQPMTTKRNFTV